MFKKNEKSKPCFFSNFLGSVTLEVRSSFYFHANPGVAARAVPTLHFKSFFGLQPLL